MQAGAKKVGYARAKGGQRQARYVLIGLERNGQEGINQCAQHASADGKQQRDHRAARNIAAHESEGRAHVHHALYAQVQVPGLFGDDFTQRAVQQRNARQHGGIQESKKSAHHLTSFLRCTR